jgi:hypothetical protein
MAMRRTLDFAVAIFEQGLHLVHVDIVNRDPSFKPTVIALAEQSVLVLGFGSLFAADGQNTIGEMNVDVLQDEVKPVTAGGERRAHARIEDRAPPAASAGSTTP